MDISTIVEMARAWFRYDNRSGGNEIFLDGKPNTNDPTKIRQGTFDASTWLGGFSGDFLTGDPANPRRAEKVLVGLKLESDGGCLEVFCQRPNTDDDANMIRIMRISNGGIEFFGRKIADSGGLIGGGTAGGRFYSPSGRWLWNYQDDGSVVLYDTHNSTNEGTWTAKWAQRPTGALEIY